ncbi:hypothetical protein BHE74_00058374 [Ensete ventricosum]|nr:hypothetical protein BHE74_00058374 [Ensete ventricosum]
MHLLLPKAAKSDLLLPFSLIVANSDPCDKKLLAVIFRYNMFTSLSNILIATSNKLNTTVVVSRSIPLLPFSATSVYIATPSSSYCSRTLVATDATCSHEVAPQPQPTFITKGPQPTLLLSFSSSTIAATLGYHPPLGDFTTAASTLLPLLPST